MSLKFGNLNCCVNVCKRIAETCGIKDFTFLLPSLTVKKTNDSAHIGLEIPINCLPSISNDNEKALLSMKTDGTINRIYKNPNNDSIIFDIKKVELIRSLLNSHLNKNLAGRVEESKVNQNTVIVEFSSPNIAKPFHVGHLRSTIVGNFVANILELSQPVKRLNYLGDWGTQIGLVKAGLELSNIGDVSLLENPMKELYNAYTLANKDSNMLIKAKEIFSNLEKGLSDDWQKEWEQIRLITIEHLKKTYDNFGIHFDEYAYESKYRASNISSVIKLLESNGLSTIEDNCLVMNMNEEKVPLFKSDGTSLYFVRDIAAALERITTYNCESIIYVVDKSQSEHLNKLKFAISKLTQLDVIKFVPFGRITGMSTRKGTGIFLEDILNETINKMAEQQMKSPNTRTSDPEVTKILGVTALMVYVLKQRRNRDFSFSWENALKGTGDTGVKLQYTHCRLCSLEKKNRINLPAETDPTVLSEPVIFDLIFELARYSEVVKNSQEDLESAQLVSYLFKLCNLVSRCLKELPVKGQCEHIASQRLLLFHAARSSISSTMKLLGLNPLREM